jgi:phosphoribosylglycinamide formyltransferase-1
MYRLAVLVSGSGTNLQALIEACRSGDLDARIEMVVSDREGAYAIERARASGISATVVPRKKHGSELSDRILQVLPRNVDLIVLAGFLSILRGEILRRYDGRILNIHPALLPDFGGHGMYGLNVHRAVLESGAKETGCTVHLVDEGTDTGPPVLYRHVRVRPEDTPESLADRVRAEEHTALIEGIRRTAHRLGLTEEGSGARPQAAADRRSG